MGKWGGVVVLRGDSCGGRVWDGDGDDGGSGGGGCRVRVVLLGW